MNFILAMDNHFKKLLKWLNDFLPQIALRFFLAYEFGQAGLRKLEAANWFDSAMFPIPFSYLPASVNWNLVVWTEIVGAAMLIVGLGTRYACFALIILDWVAWVSVHGANGYNICDNGYKMTLMLMIMLVTLICMGPGKLSIDNFVRVKR